MHHQTPCFGAAAAAAGGAAAIAAKKKRKTSANWSKWNGQWDLCILIAAQVANNRKRIYIFLKDNPRCLEAIITKLYSL